MKEYLEEIKKLSQMGLEKAILHNEINSKDIFYKILLRTEIELNKTDKTPEIKQNKTEYEHLGDKRVNMLITAYCLSKYEHTSIFSGITQKEAFKKISDILGIKQSTLKLTRDIFDGHNNSKRKGWQADMPESLKKIKEKYDKIDKADVINEVKQILNI